MSTAARRSLENRLGNFLGFQDESLSDVLDHLLSIEGSDDLLDYLSQLLGDDQSDDIKVFVEDIGKFQRGEEIAILIMEDDTSTANVPATEDTPTTTARNKQPQEENVTKTKPAADKVPSTKSNATNKQGKAEPVISSPVAATTAPSAVTTKSKLSSEPQKELAKTTTTPAPPPKKRGPPPRGKAARNCGCFGTLHKPLTNCLYCGRISCETEGYDFCPFCGFLVEEVKPPEGGANRYVLMSLVLCPFCRVLSVLVAYRCCSLRVSPILYCTCHTVLKPKLGNTRNDCYGTIVSLPNVRWYWTIRPTTTATRHRIG